jgi:chemotaxis response regulator CheB
MASAARLSTNAQTATPRIRALVVNDSPKSIADISSILEQDERVDVVATALDGVVALRTALTHSPDLIVIDMDTAYLSGIETTALLKQRLPQAKVIIVCTDEASAGEACADEDRAMALDAVGFGADAFLPSHRLSAECGSQLIRLFPA